MYIIWNYIGEHLFIGLIQNVQILKIYNKKLRLLKDQMKIELAGARNAHKDLIADFIEDIQPMQQSHTEMDFLNQRRYATEKVCATLGVPRTLLNYTDGVNYSNSETQYKIFIENTVIPWETLLDNVFSEIFEPFGVDFTIISDHIDRIAETVNLTDKMIANGTITRNEAREILKQPRSEADEMDSHTVSSSTILLDNLIMQ
jgi:HK97 family phage portal protein